MAFSNQLTICVRHQCCSGITQHRQLCLQADTAMCHQRKGGRSSIEIKNSVGPKTEPCGTPENTPSSEEDSPLMTTLCLLFIRKS